MHTSHIDPVRGDTGVLPVALWFARVGIDVELGEVAAGDVDPETVSRFEEIGGGEHPDRDGIDDIRSHHDLAIPSITVAHP